MRPLSLAHLTFLDLPPPSFVRLAAEAGFASVGLRLMAVTDTTPGYPLMTDPVMMRETLQALRDTGVTVNDIEFVRITPDFDLEKFALFFAAGAELGARHIVTAPYDPDLVRLADHLSKFSDQAAGFGLTPVLEFFPWTSVPDFSSALNIVTNTGNPSIGVLLDTLHFDRSGSRLSDIAAADPSRLPFIHLCDAEVRPSYTEAQLIHTARAARSIPGQAQIALGSILAQLPDTVPIAIELPMEAAMRDPSDLVQARRIFAYTQQFLTRVAR